MGTHLSVPQPSCSKTPPDSVLGKWEHTHTYTRIHKVVMSYISSTVTNTHRRPKTLEKTNTEAHTQEATQNSQTEMLTERQIHMQTPNTDRDREAEITWTNRQI